jgi:hypothetical protein
MSRSRAGVLEVEVERLRDDLADFNEKCVEMLWLRVKLDGFVPQTQHVNLRKVLLENRPEKPLEFIANYFANALQVRA